MPLALIQSCSSCAHFDGDGYCTVPVNRLVIGFIPEPQSVVCDQHVLPEKDEA